MPPKWVVRSVHINIGTGDSAAHYLVDVANGARTIHSSVLIDGGHAGEGSAAIDQFLKGYQDAGNIYTRHDGLSVAMFDTLGITHWDSDHVDGVVKLFSLDLNKKIQDAINQNGSNLITKAKVEEAIEAGAFLSSYTMNDGTTNTPPRPITPVVAPYWDVDDSETRPTPEKAPTDAIDVWEDPKNSVWYMRVQAEYKLQGVVENSYVPIARLPWAPWPQYGKKCVGRNLFSLNESVPINSRKCCQSISSFLDTQAVKRPYMVCVGCDSWICDDSVLFQRSMKYYANSEDFQEVCISATHPDDPWWELPFPRFKKPQRDQDLSTSSVTGTTTGNNQASVACM